MMDCSAYYQEKVEKYLPVLINKSKNISSLGFDNKCMLILGLYTYIESIHAFQSEYDSCESCDVNDVRAFVKEEHSPALHAFDKLVMVKDEVTRGCYIHAGRKTIEDFVDSDELMAILTEFGIVTVSDLNKAFRAASLMGGN